jgi:tetratricopeptide (TPR) repeat protein
MRILVTLAALVASVISTAAAPRPWTLIRGQNVIVIGQQPAKRLRGVALEIEQFKAALGGLMRGAAEPLPLATVVYTFDDRKALEPFVPLYQGKPAALGGFCHCGTGAEGSFIAVNLSSDPESSRIIFHEYTHLLVRQATRSLPLWLNEGLAEYYSTFRLTSDGREAEVGVPIVPHVALLRRQFIPIAELVAVDQSSALYNETERRSIFYAEAWALTHFLLMERPNGAAAMNTYVADVAAGRPAGQAFASAFGVTPAGMDAALRQYVRHPVFRSVTHTLTDRVDVDQPDAAQTISPAEADARLGMVQLRVGRVQEATLRIEAAAAAGPDVAQAQLALGLVRLDQRQQEEALPPLERAATLAPDDFSAQYTFALTLLKRVGDRPVGGATDPRERAHAALTRAIAVNPRSADALAWQAYAALVLDAHIPEARAAIMRAVALAPERVDYRLRLTEICVRQGDFAEARRLLAGLVIDRDEEVAHTARELLASIDTAERRRQAAAAAARAQQQAAAQTIAREADQGFRAQVYVKLRTVKRGEERAYGQLTQVDCSPEGLRLYLTVGERAISVTAKRVEDIATASFLDDKDRKVICGTREPPDDVFLTWRPAKGARTGTAPIVGDAVAVEFVPKGAIPQ